MAMRQRQCVLLESWDYEHKGSAKLVLDALQRIGARPVEKYKGKTVRIRCELSHVPFTSCFGIWLYGVDCDTPHIPAATEASWQNTIDGIIDVMVRGGIIEAPVGWEHRQWEKERLASEILKEQLEHAVRT